MANTEFFKKVSSSNKNSLTWKDIFSDSFRKHSKAEFEFAITAGLRVGQSRSNMFDAWRKPWLWFSFLEWSVILVGLVYAVVFVLEYLGVVLVGLDLLIFIIPAYVVTLAVMILLWELNVPRDVSIFYMMAYFAVGGILSTFFTGIMLLSGIYDILEASTGIPGATFAPIIEEPAKLLAGIFLVLEATKKKKRITGLTGLLIGAGVGAGFTGIESMQYVFLNTATPMDAIELALMRSSLVGGHILFCAPYIAMLCLNYNKYPDWKGRLTDKGFLTAFGISCLVHAAWNFFGSIVIGIVIEIPLILYLLYVIKLCIGQTLHSSAFSNKSGAKVSFVQIQCIQGSLHGRLWQIPGSGRLTLGRDKGCDIVIADSSSGISRNHCVIDFKNGRCIVKDLNSTNGTFVDAQRLRAGESTKLFDGQVVKLGKGNGAMKFKIQIINC